MSDFQFSADQEETEDSGAIQVIGQHGIIPSFHDKIKIFQPSMMGIMPVGGVAKQAAKVPMEAPVAPAKPTLHVGELESASLGWKGKTSEGDSVFYNYFKGKPFFANIITPGAGFKSSYSPEHVEFPPAPAPKLALPTLHSEEPKHIGAYTAGAKTADGGQIFYNYHPDGKPLNAELYDAQGNFKNDELTPENIAFPEFTALKKTNTLDELDTEITKLVEPAKPTLHTGEPITDSAQYEIFGTGFEGKKDVIPYTSKKGGTIYFSYINGKPHSAVEYDSTWNYVSDYNSHEINFPEHLKLEGKQEHAIHKHYSTQFAHYKSFDGSKPEFEFTKPLTAQPSVNDDWFRAETKDGIIDFGYKRNSFEPIKAVFYPKTEDGYGNPKKFNPDEINFPQHPLEQIPWKTETSTLHIGKPLWSGYNETEYDAANGGKIKFFYGEDGVTPKKALYFPHGWDGVEKELSPNEVVFPNKPSTNVTLGKVQWGPDPNSQEAHANAVIKGETGHIYFNYANGKPVKALFFDSAGNSKYKFTPEEIEFPSHPSKPTLPKLNLASEYPEEKPIEELYEYSPPTKTLVEPQSGRAIKYINHYPDLSSNFVTDREYDLIKNRRFSEEIYSGKIQEHAEDIKVLNNAIEKFALPEPITIARGVSSRVFRKFASVPIGKTATHSGFFQAADVKVLPTFAENWRGGEQLIVNLPAGTKAFPASAYTGLGEAEYMLQTGQRFKIVDKTDKTITLELVPRQRPIPPEENFPIDKYMLGKHLYHASPYEFASFDFGKVGTGESKMTNPTNHSPGKFMGYAGAYLAENPGVANKYYKDFKIKGMIEAVERQLEDPQSGFNLQPEELHSVAQEAVSVSNHDIYARQKELQNKDNLSDKDKARIAAFQIRRDEDYRQHAFVYRTLAHIDDRLLIDGDKSLSAQSPYVLSALKRAGIDTSKTNDVKQILPQTHDEMMNYFNVGIQGVRFLDKHSRENRSETPTYNYAVYDEGALDITKKGQLSSEGKWINTHGD